MRYYATASGQKPREAIAAGLLGQIRTPAAGNALVDGATWVADNGAFNPATFSIYKWGRWLLAQPRTAEWVTVPDVLHIINGEVIGDHAATVRRWHRYAPWVRSIGFTPAFVLQDGCTPGQIPPDAGAVFVGGSTNWKVSASAHACVLEGQRRGIPTHMGRVNSWSRYKLAASWGCDSVDGTCLAFGPDVNTPKVLRWVASRQSGTQQALLA